MKNAKHKAGATKSHTDSKSFIVTNSKCIEGPKEVKDKDKDKDLFIGPQQFVVGYSKAPEHPQSSARPICHSHAMTRTGCEPYAPYTLLHRSSPRYALHHGRVFECQYDMSK